MLTKVSERGQVTIPKPLRERLGIEPGNVLDFEAEAGHLVGRKTTPRDPVDSVYGVLHLPGGTDEMIHELRGSAA